MKKYSDFVLDARGNALNAATVTVVNYPSGTAATIYSDDGTTVIAGGIITTSSTGLFEFYAPPGRYNLQVRVAGALLRTITDVQIDEGISEEVASIAALKALKGMGSLQYSVRVLGYYTAGDGGGGEFYWDAASSATDNGGTVIAANAGGVGRWRWADSATVIDVRRFGVVNGQSTAVMTAGLAAAAASLTSGGTLIVDGVTVTVNAATALLSNTTVEIRAGASIQTATTSISILAATSKNNVVVRGPGKLKYTAAGSSGLIGGVTFDTCTYCKVDGVEFEGMQFAGVYLTDSDYNTISNNRIHSTLGTHSDANDITVYNNSDYNLVVGNRCFGSGAHGILIQGPGATTPSHNIVSKNFVNEKSAYGIVVYQITAADTFNTIDDNDVYDILGTALAGASGSGIYIQTAGGTKVTNNRVRNTCRSTTSSTNGPAAISLASNGSLREPQIATGNHIDAPKWRGILLSDSAAEAIISNNHITFADGTNGEGIRVVDSSNFILSSNKVRAATTVARAGITVFASGASITNANVSGNVVNGTDANLFNVTRSGAFTVQGAFVGNIAVSTGTNSQAFNFGGLVNSTISGNQGSGVFAGLVLDNSNNVRGAGNVMRATTYTFLTNAANTNAYFDSSNDFDIANTGRILSSAGTNIEQRAAAAPATGSWAVGDRIEQLTPVVGNPKGWRCTVTGTPGTWVSEGNL